MQRAVLLVMAGVAVADVLGGCPDAAPDSQYTCAQQKSWGKCGKAFMVGHCCQTCFSCAAGCGGPAPAPRPACVGQTPELSQSGAGPTAQALFQKLAGHWRAGETLSGHTGGPKGSDYENSWDDMVRRVGKTPAVKAFDMQNYSPHNPWHQDWSSWDDGSVGEAISWYQSTGSKGIVAFEWHWFSPMGGSLQTSTFYTKDTDFDTAKAVTPGTAEYQATVRDLNAIATQLGRLRDAGVPILWRPLHEAAGNSQGAWFWWGRAGPDACKQLLSMMRDVFINQHGLNNLLWVWSEPNPAWYPGNDKMDMVGFDSYPGAYIYDCNEAMWNQLSAMTGCRKLVALTEVGPIPDIGTCAARQVEWLYFLTWGSVGAQDNTDQHLKDVYGNPRVKSVDNLSSGSLLAV